MSNDPLPALVENAKNQGFGPRYAWLMPARAGRTCDQCNSDENVVEMHLRIPRISVQMCCACLEVACEYAQP